MERLWELRLFATRVCLQYLLHLRQAQLSQLLHRISDTADFDSPVRLGRVHAPGAPVVFGAGHKEGSGLMHLVQPCEIQIASIHHVIGGRDKLFASAHISRRQAAQTCSCSNMVGSVTGASTCSTMTCLCVEVAPSVKRMVKLPANHGRRPVPVRFAQLPWRCL